MLLFSAGEASPNIVFMCCVRESFYYNDVLYWAFIQLFLFTYFIHLPSHPIERLMSEIDHETKLFET